MSQFMMLLVEDDPLQREIFADILKEGLRSWNARRLRLPSSSLQHQGSNSRSVADQNLEGHMFGSELAVFACKMFPRMNFVLISATIRLVFPRPLGSSESPSCRTC